MIRRRDLVFGSLAVGGVIAAEALRPRRKMTLLKGPLEKAIPVSFGNWEAHADHLVNPEQAGRLARTLYSEIVSRTYVNSASGEAVMLLAAYGDTQSDLLQLHRPESCYPAVGFTLKSARSIALPVADGALLPAREVIAEIEDRRENIIYWTRMGEALPQTGGEQRDARLANAMRGLVPDGILVRCSVVGDSESSFKLMERFIPSLLAAVGQNARAALVGTHLAHKLVGAERKAGHFG